MAISPARKREKPPSPSYPSFFYEDQCGYENVCGIDEVGRGPLAGPVVAACVVIPYEKRTLPFVREIRDSKKLNAIKLQKLYDQITTHFPYAIAEIHPEEIDEINILQASLKAMSHATNTLNAQHNIHHALVDGNKMPKLPCRGEAVVKGDSFSTSIAAASIIAKIHRDKIMVTLAREYPHYGWDRNVGYPTAEHIHALAKYGITPHHRKSFGPVKKWIAANMQ